MDCDTVRLFMQFDRPGGAELVGAEADELHAHLEQCSACNALAMNARRVDQRLGRAMHAVEVPGGLKTRLLDRLAEERGAVRRRWLRRIGPIGAVAASLLLLLGAYAWLTSPPVAVRGDHILYGINASPAFPAGAPEFVNYAYLVGPPSKGELPGYPRRVVPQLVFAQAPPLPVALPKGRADQLKLRKAVVYILPGNQEVVPPEEDSAGYEYKLHVEKPDESSYKYLILYNGDNWDWLRAKRDE